MLRDGGVDDVLIVVADEEPSIAAALVDVEPPPRCVVNRTPDSGQHSSLQVGLREVDRPGVGGVLATLVDVPLITAGVVRALLEAHSRTRAPVVRPVRRGRHGHPVIFDRSVFDELRSATAATGAKAVVRNHAAESVQVPVEDEGAFLDIDTPGDYERVFRQPVSTESDGQADGE